MSKSRGDLAGLTFGKASRPIRARTRGGAAVTPRELRRSNSDRFSVRRSACRGLEGEAGSFARHSQLPDRACWSVALTNEEAISAGEVPTAAEGVASVEQQPQAEAGRPSQQLRGAWAGSVAQAEATPGSDIIPITAARAIQGRRGW